MIEIYSDGGARPNPGEAGIGFVAYRDGEKILTGYQYFQKLTNNQAEFIGAINALGTVYSHFEPEEAILHVDSELVYGSTLHPLEAGYKKIKAENLVNLHASLIEVISIYKKLTIKWISREENKEADSLVNTAITTKSTKFLKWSE